MVGVLVCAYSLSFADRMVMSLLIGPIKHDLGTSDFQVSLLIGLAFAFFYVLMGLPCGYLADRMNRRNLIACGVLLWSLATGACGIAGTFATLFLARMAVGAAEATLSPSAYSMIADSFPPQRLGRAISVYVLGNPLGTGAALALGGAMIGALAQIPVVHVPLLGDTAGWRVVFLALFLPGVLLSALILGTVREPARRIRPERIGKALHWSEAPRYIAGHGRAFFCQFGGTCLLSLAVYGSMAWIPAFFERSHGMPAAQIGVYFGAMLGIGGIAGLLFGGYLGDLLLKSGCSDAYPRVMAGAAIAAIAPGVAMCLVADTGAALVLTAVTLTITGMTTGISAAAVQHITPSHLRGQVGAIYILAASVSGIGLGPSFVAFLTEFVFGDEAALRYALAALAAVTLPLAAILLIAGLPFYRKCAAARID
ncbi:MAG: MFS transporter [Novosphingobium sp.]